MNYSCIKDIPRHHAHLLAVFAAALAFVTALPPVSAQSTGTGQCSILLDLVALNKEVTIGGQSKISPLGTEHKWLARNNETASGKIVFAGLFVEWDKLVIGVEKTPFVSDVAFYKKIGPGLKERSEQNRLIIERVKPVSHFQLQQRYLQLKSRIAKLRPVEFAREYQRQFGTKVSSQSGLRDRLTAAQAIPMIQSAEKTLWELKIVTDKEKFQSPKLRATTALSIIEKYVDSLQVGLEKALVYDISVSYIFDMRTLGVGPADYPDSAFVPGALDQGITAITVNTKVAPGNKSVLWYRLPAFQSKAHEIEITNSGPDWLLKRFPGPNDGDDLLLAVVIPKDAKGNFIFKWKLIGQSGTSLTVRRPVTLKYPY